MKAVSSENHKVADRSMLMEDEKKWDSKHIDSTLNRSMQTLDPTKATKPRIPWYPAGFHAQLSMRSADTISGGKCFVFIAKLQATGSIPQYVKDMTPEDGKFYSRGSSDTMSRKRDLPRK